MPRCSLRWCASTSSRRTTASIPFSVVSRHSRRRSRGILRRRHRRGGAPRRPTSRSPATWWSYFPMAASTASTPSFSPRLRPGRRQRCSRSSPNSRALPRNCGKAVHQNLSYHSRAMENAESILRTHRAHDVRVSSTRAGAQAGAGSSGCTGGSWRSRIACPSRRSSRRAGEIQKRAMRCISPPASTATSRARPKGCSAGLACDGRHCATSSERGDPFPDSAVPQPVGPAQQSPRERQRRTTSIACSSAATLSPVREVSRPSWPSRMLCTAAFMLHEDYDALGTYLYEVVPTRRIDGWGEKMLIAAAGRIIPPDPTRDH